MTALPAEPSPAAASLYDARRGIYYVKPKLRGRLHLLWFAASLACGPLLVVPAHGAQRIAALAVYAASVSALFGISALYHCGTWTAAAMRRLQRVDHATIFFLIAGTATPAFLLTAPGAFAMTCLIILWTLTLTAAAIHLASMNAPEIVVGATFVGLGWVGRPVAALGLDQRGCHVRGTDGRRRRALYARRALLSSSLAGPLSVSVRLSRGLPRVRLRGGGLPVPGDSPIQLAAGRPSRQTTGFARTRGL